MLKVMRRSFQHLKWVLWFVVIVFVAFIFVDWGMGRVRGDKATSGEVATLHGEPITAADFDRQYKQTEDRYRQMYKGNWSPALAKAMDLPNQVLNGMIERRMLLEAAQRTGLRVADAELAGRIQAMPAFQRNGQFVGASEYASALAAYGLTVGQFERGFREDMLIEKYNALVAASLVIPEERLKSQFEAQNEKAKVEYVLLPPARLAASAPAAPSDAELMKFYDGNKDLFREPERRKLKYLLVEQSKLREKLKPSPAEIQAYYDAHSDDFAVAERVHAAHILIKTGKDATPAEDAAAKKKAEDVLARAKKGEDFAELARKYSDDPGSKAQGGDLPPFARGQMVPPFEEAAFSMSPGEIRGPVKSDFGYHVIKLMAKLPAGKQTLAEATPRIASILTQDQMKAAEQRKAEALQKAIGKNASDADLRKLADDVVSFDATDWVTAQGQVPGIGYAPGFLKAAFALKKGEVSPQPVPTPRGLAIVKVADVKPPGIPEFAEVRAKVAAEYARRQTEERELGAARPVVAELRGGADLAAVAKRYQADVQTPAEFGKGAPIGSLGASPALADAIFKTPAGQYGDPVALPGKGVVIYRVVSKTDFDPAAFAAQKDKLADAARQQEAQKLIEAELAHRRSQEKIVVNDEILKRYTQG
ncbi:MAG TPA: peptidyl-prolyl cis-trans isomerase [Thermoanaerobaculia bacterium]|jgi:peptidyl-prolyl cis-trans isomerase D|nr:peptidyl-prolyl cis-trans isomerase [Thermoanaerobaculia bacterium]